MRLKRRAPSMPRRYEYEWVFLAVCLLRRAPVPFRYLDERWPDATAALVRSARQALDQ